HTLAVSQVTYADPLSSTYQAAGGDMRNIFQLDFTGLHIVATGGTTISFGVIGTSSATTPDDPVYWFNHASNAGLGGVPPESADGVMQEYSWDGVSSTASLIGPFDSNGNGWDKSSDINVQVFGTVPEPVTASILGVGLLGLAAVRRRAAK